LNLEWYFHYFIIIPIDNVFQKALAQICEYSEAGITVRGTYFPPGKQPKEEERKLYLAIEATSEMAIQKAKKEVTRLIKEELFRLVIILIYCF
jgi:ATP-dependent RNA helicase DDX46/PRP5